jgi:hypothetical protein
MATTAQSKLTGSGNGLGVAVVYTPDSRKMSGPLGFSAPAARPKSRSKQSADLESKALFLHSGTQFIEAEKWELIYAFPSNKTQIDRLVRKRSIVILKPELVEGVQTGTTLDFLEADDAILLVENCYSLEWLRASYAQETSRVEVKKACSDRIETVSKLAADKQLPMSTFGG